MSDRPYSRVYWTVVDDPKFETIYDNDNHLAAWLRMLLIADQAFPASGQIPSNARKASVRALAEVGLIDLSGGRFRIRGLDAERARRTASARVGGLASGRSRAVEQTLNDHPTSKRTKPNLDEDETRRGLDEPRQDEHPAREGLPNLDQDAIRALEDRTGRPWSMAGQRQLSEYDRLIEDHGIEAVCGAMDALRDGKTMTARQLVWGAMKVLEPMIDTRVAADAERAEEVERNSRRGVEETQRYLRELRSVGAPPGESA